MDGENKRKREREKEAITGQPIKYPFTSPEQNKAKLPSTLLTLLFELIT